MGMCTSVEKKEVIKIDEKKIVMKKVEKGIKIEVQKIVSVFINKSNFIDYFQF